MSSTPNTAPTERRLPVDGAATEVNGGTGRVPGAEAERTAELTAQVAALEDRWRRTLADLENLRKRQVTEAEHQRAHAERATAALLLPIVDNLDLALEHATKDPEALVNGVRAVRDQAIDALRALAFPRQEDLGARFDPTLHDAVMVTPDPSTPPGTVVGVVRPRYGEGDRQLRPASVIVSGQAGPSRG